MGWAQQGEPSVGECGMGHQSKNSCKLWTPHDTSNLRQIIGGMHPASQQERKTWSWLYSLRGWIGGPERRPCNKVDAHSGSTIYVDGRARTERRPCSKIDVRTKEIRSEFRVRAKLLLLLNLCGALLIEKSMRCLSQFAQRFASFCDIPKTDCNKYSLVISKVLLFGRNIDQRFVVGNLRSSTFV